MTSSLRARRDRQVTHFRDPWPDPPPPSTPVLDSFNAGATQLLTARTGIGWSSVGLYGPTDVSWRTDAVPTVADCTLTPASAHSNLWGTLYAANQEAWFTYGSGIDSVTLIARGDVLSSSGISSSYKFGVGFSGYLELAQHNTVLVSANVVPSPVAGDSYCLQVVGSNLYGWKRPSGGAWTLMLAAVNAAFTNAGYIGILETSASNIATITDFGGGESPYVAPAAARSDIVVVRRTWGGR